jgi:hypothetical protein
MYFFRFEKKDLTFQVILPIIPIDSNGIIFCKDIP